MEKRCNILINIKLTILHWFYNPGFRVLLLFLLIFRFLYFSPFYVTPLRIRYLFYGIGIILVYYFVLIIWLECLAEIFINTKLNKKQNSFLSKRYSLFVLPLSAYLVYNVFSVDLASINILTVSWGIITSFLVFFLSTKSVRYSFVLSWILATVFFFKVNSSFEIIFWSMGLSNLLILLLIRYSELNPHLWVQNSILDKNKIRKDNLLNKSKEKMVKSKEVYFLKEEPYFLREDGLFDKFENRISNKKIIDEVNSLKRIKEKIYLAKFNSFLRRLPLLKKINLPIDKEGIYRFNLLMRGLKFVDIILFSIITIIAFNPKANRRIAKLTLDNYDDFITVDKKLDRKELWKSDLDMDITGEEEREYQFIINQITFYFNQTPSRTFLPDLKKVIGEYKKKIKKHEEVINQRVDYAEKTYGKNSKLLWSYSRLKRGVDDSKKYLASISGAIK